MSRALADIFLELHRDLKKVYPPKKVEAFEKEVTRLQMLYTNIKIEERHEETYDSLCKRGVELLKPGNLKDEEKLRYFLRYCGAALYDFKDNTDALKWIIRSYMVTVMFFYIITPQYFGYILPLIMVVPIFVGMRGMKKRSLNGLITACSVVPLALMVGTVHFKSIFLAMGTGYGQYVAEQAVRYNVPVEFAASLMTMVNACAVIMMVAGIATAYNGIKHNKLFI